MFVTALNRLTVFWDEGPAEAVLHSSFIHSFFHLGCLSLQALLKASTVTCRDAVHDSGQYCQGPPLSYHLDGVQEEPLLVLLRVSPVPQ